MSCTVFALPYALAWIIGIAVTGEIKLAAGNNDESMQFENADIRQQSFELPNINEACDDVHVISEKHFLEKSFETPFTDKEILMRTLEEHGIVNLKENEYGKITGRTGNYALAFERTEADKPYYLIIRCLNTENAEEKLNDLSSEYAINVQEESYNSIIEKLNDNNMQIENEEVLDDNTIVLTVNLE